MPLYRIRNYGQAPQGFYEDPAEAMEGVDNAMLPVFVPPGESRDLNISGAQLDAAKALHKSRAITVAPVVGGEVGGEVEEAEMGEPVEPERDTFDEMSDEALRAFITTRDGKPPHPALGRPKLLDRARTDPEPAAPEAATGEGEAV